MTPEYRRLSDKIIISDPVIDLEDIPAGKPCLDLDCGAKTRKIHLEYEFGESPRIRFEQLAGYSCETCGDEYFSHEGLVAAWTQAQVILQGLGLENRARALDASIQRSLRFIAEQSTLL